VHLSVIGRRIEVTADLHCDFPNYLVLAHFA
jgi:hypothetical protein